MGLADLRQLAVITSIEPDEIAGSIVAVDAYNWLHRYLSIVVQYTDRAAYTAPDGTEVPNLIGLVDGVPKFYEHGLSPVFVFDGAAVDLKEDELDRRRQRRRSAEEHAERAEAQGDDTEAARFRAQAQRVTPAIERTTQAFLDLLGVPHLVAPLEAEAQAAYMARADDVGYVVSEDYDALLYGAPLTLRQFTSSGKLECMAFDATLERHGITWRQLVEIAILCGTDYNEGIHGVGPQTALTELKQHGDLEAVLETRGVEIPAAERIRELFLHPSVTDDYEVGQTGPPDLEAARSYVTEDWGIPDDRVANGFARLEEALGAR